MALAPHKRFTDHRAGQVFGDAWRSGQQYLTQVNRGDLNAEDNTRVLNAAFASGFSLRTMFEQHGNTVMVFERRPAQA